MPINAVTDLWLGNPTVQISKGIGQGPKQNTNFTALLHGLALSEETGLSWAGWPV
ncbi:MAG: hypothetical protein V7775_23915 [Sulfitobacter sp.]